MWLRSQFIIGPIHELMGHSHMVNMTWNPFLIFFRYAPRMSQALKDHIWAQLSLGYTTKQIYDKHKTIWWERVNASQNMTRDDFIQLQNIAYLDWKHKKGSWCLHTNLAISIQSWALQHPEMCSFSKMLVKSIGLKSHSS